MIIESLHIQGPIRDKADVCIIGSGSAGSILAYRLQKAGMRVIVLEEGGYYTNKDFTSNPTEMMGKLYKNRGLMMTVGTPVIPICQGRCVGGSSVINTGTCFRTPISVLEDWEKNEGVEGLSASDLLPHFQDLEQVLGVGPVLEALVGRNNLILKSGLEKLGWRGALLPKNAPTCIGCSRCNIGCPINAKKSMLITYLPMASDLGTKIYADCRVEQILTQRRRAVGVRGAILDRATEKREQEFEILADRVILCAGAFGSPMILQKSHLANSSGQVGKNLHIHPAGAAFALFPEEILGWQGNPQGFGIYQFEEEGILIESSFGPVELMASSLPFGGKEHKEWMAQFKHWAAYGALIKDESSGSVRWLPGWRPWVTYHLTPSDATRIVRGLQYLAQAYFASGARDVYAAIRGFPILHSMEEVELAWKRYSVNGQDLELAAFHPMGTCRMGADRKRAVVDSRCQTYDIENLYICDSSVLPTALGVNPQLTIMAVASRTAERMIHN
ncbi:MAG: GMC family oxidoreductase [Deltaproteobacteria bacterium]|nr:GMC family oxidoreductase [Deltaproteobacteria bacterium]